MNDFIRMQKDFIRSSNNTDERITIGGTATGRKSASPLDISSLVPVDNRITAEHILQLCKFLAEKSKKNKKHNHKYHQNISEKDSPVTCDSGYSAAVGESAMDFSRLSPDVLIPHHVLSDKTQSSTSCNKINSCAREAQQQYQQGKRDILQKIRSQIFERKRQRQLANMQRMGVWRPW